MTQAVTRLSARLMRGPPASLAAASSSSPSQAALRQTRARMATAFSPTPPVNTSASSWVLCIGGGVAPPRRSAYHSSAGALFQARLRALPLPGAEVDVPDESGPAGILPADPCYSISIALAPDQLAVRGIPASRSRAAGVRLRVRYSSSAADGPGVAPAAESKPGR